MQFAHLNVRMIYREVADHKRASDAVFRPGLIGKYAHVRAKEDFSLGRRPDALQQLVKDPGVVC